MSVYDSLIFDLDGTLWDAAPTSAIAWSKTSAKLGLKVDVSEAVIKSVTGLPFDRCIEIVFGESLRHIPNLGEMLEQAEFDEITAAGGRLYDGVVSGVRALSETHKLYLVSNCQEWYMTAFFNHSGLAEYFSDSLCYGQTNRPKSENISEIVRRNSLQQPVYIGDTEWDLEAADAAGVDFIFASYGFGKIAGEGVGSVCRFSDLLERVRRGE